MCWIGVRSMTYSLRNLGLHQQSRVEDDVLAVNHGTNALSAGDIGVALVGQQSGHESAGVCDIGSHEGAIEDVVCQQGSEGARVGSQCLALLSAQKLSEGLIRGSEDGDVLSIAESLYDSRLRLKDGSEVCEFGGRGESGSEVLGLGVLS